MTTVKDAASRFSTSRRTAVTRVTGTPEGVGGDPAARAPMWARPHVVFLLIAYGFSWTLWIAGWIVADLTDAGDLLFNEDFVWRVGFVRDVAAPLLIATGIAFFAVYGPMIGGIIATALDPNIPKGSLRQRVRDVGVGGREYALVLAVLLGVTLPALVITVATGTRSADAPSSGQLIGFLVAFFALQLLTSGTEEIGWRGYLTEKLLPGRGFWDTGWLVGIVWAVWHLPVATMIFLQQGMAPVQIAVSLVGFAMGIVAMAILQAWFYKRTRSVFLSMVIHAAFNTLPLTLVLLWEESPAAVVTDLLLWAVVIYLRTRSQRTAKAMEV
ncbi:MAG: CPBP family intramembrane metalloprotease [Kineosporiaceae bacterium]|nr:CPBP family intramembrane metalloprotease [Kineosporiaceae bacterium]